jgi:hypothetical protein
VCTSGVCDPTDNQCGFANGDGSCIAANGGTVCRSGVCSANGTCQPSGGCNVDADCTGGQWCNEGTHLCVVPLANGVGIPTDPPHSSPALNGACTPSAGALVCASAVCDTDDNLCGFGNADGPCTAANGAIVCRSAVCATTGANSGVCVACVDDSTCDSPTPACNTTSNTCVQCTPSSATLCTGNSPVCDAASNTCSACNGDLGSSATDACNDSAGPYCTAAGACFKCASNANCTTGTHNGPFCDLTTGQCAKACQSDTDCSAGSWCDDLGAAGTGKCEVTVPNGQPVPGGICSASLGARACVAGVCGKDNECGLKSGEGPCTAASGATVCRSAVCATSGANSGQCVACVNDSTCAGPTPTCNTTSNTCAQCTPSSATLCAGNSPVCDGATGICSVCNGDFGSGATDACTSSTDPYCTAAGACARCASNANCTTGMHNGPFCALTTGQCGKACLADKDCSAGSWCDDLGGAGTGKCEVTVPNGQPVPGGKCTAAVGARACVAGVCDTDNVCGSGDAGSGPRGDASAPFDATVGATPGNNDSVHGGGLSCAAAPGGSPTRGEGGALALVTGIAIGIARRRRSARASASSTR